MKTLGSIFPVLRYDRFPSLNPKTDMNAYNDYGYLLDWWVQDGIPLGLVEMTSSRTGKKQILVIKVFEQAYTADRGKTAVLAAAKEHRRVATERHRDYILFFIGSDHVLSEADRRDGPVWGMPELNEDELLRFTQEHEHEYYEGYCENCGEEDPDFPFDEDEDCDHDWDEDGERCLNCGYER